MSDHIVSSYVHTHNGIAELHRVLSELSDEDFLAIVSARQKNLKDLNAGERWSLMIVCDSLIDDFYVYQKSHYPSGDHVE